MLFRSVRLTKGDYDRRTVYDADPVAVARRFEQLGITRLHMVDLDGARSKHVVNTAVLRSVTSATRLSVDFGGGVKSDTDMEQAFDCGAQMVTVGSVAVTEPETMIRWIGRYGVDRLILGADIRNGRLSINGWKEDSPTELMEFLQFYYDKGIRKVLCTDISKDGTLTGPNTSLYRQVMQAFPDLYLIASGGMSSANDLRELDDAGIPAVVLGKAIYENRIDLASLITSYPCP